jgi:taurine--2-oxoglutarate transaminase
MTEAADTVVYGWLCQGAERPVRIANADGIYLWDEYGREYADFASGQININVGYNHPRVLAAMQTQMQRASYVAPNLATEVRSRLAQLVVDRTPTDLQHVFFGNSGAEAIETAVKIARTVTGRSKIYSAWRSYHGATAVASAVSGDPRRLYSEPAPPSISKFHYPACYRCAFGQDDPACCGFPCLHSLESQLLLDGPETVAAILLEPIVGTSGLYIPPADFMIRLRKLCSLHGIVLIIDETMSGWGRSGRWFACEHFDISPDILVTAKGLTSGYVPLSAVVMTSRIYDYFRSRNFVAGSTTEGHALACAAGIANLEIYEEEGLVEQSRLLGEKLIKRLCELKTTHPSVGDVRGKGLFACVELTRDRSRRTPLAGYRNSQRDVATLVTNRLRQLGVMVLAKWDFIFIAPPLIISETQLNQGLEKLDDVLNVVDGLI